jgi:L-asparaginase / beta-aspartyl-peptidase
MKNQILIFIIISVFTFSIPAQTGNENAPPKPNNFTIVIHGGAGSADRSMPDSLKDLFLFELEEALTIGSEILAHGGTSLDAVEKVINYLEDSPLFNAGKGAVFTSEGTHELDASIMNGSDLSSGAVAGVKRIKNPISLARKVMENTKHILLISDGAEKFAESIGIEFVENSYFDTPKRSDSWKKYNIEADKKKKGTVGCIALDNYGDLAAGTSTGGITGKLPGRIGDSPLINSGTYANNKTCAVSCTGTGELFIKNSVAYNLSVLMEYKEMTVQEAADEMINKRLNKGDGGLIALDKNGNIAMVFNTESMLRAAANSDGFFEVSIW